MYIDEIVLENIRGFKNLKFSLKRPDSSYAGLTIFAGDNGSGKSTLLKAIAIALTGTETARALQADFKGWIYHHQKTAKITLQIKPDDQDGFIEQGKTTKKLFLTNIDLYADSDDVRLKSNDTRSSRSLWSSRQGWFACGYGPFRRVFGASSDAIRPMTSRTTERFVTMFYEAASLAEVNSWLIGLSHKKLEGKQEASEQLELVIDLLNSDLLPNEMTVARVDSDGVWLKDKNGTELTWNEMSDGYRSVIALLADIIRHLIGNGIENTKSKDVILSASGVVLIDELDAHLHPEWQMTIGHWLKKHFPNMQFLATTHSPLICQAASENGLFILPEPGSTNEPRALTPEEYTQVIASRSDVILRSVLFGLQNTRSEKIVEARQEYAVLAAKQRANARLTHAEKTQLQTLESIIEAEES